MFKANSIVRRTAPALKSIVLLSVATLGGCFLKVSGPGDGTVTSEFGADCGAGCVYKLEAGLDFRRTFTALPESGAEFIRWKDDLGDGFAGCVNPTNSVCTFDITELDPFLATLSLQVESEFVLVNGWNVSRYEYEHNTGYTGVYRQIDLTRWVEETSQGDFEAYTLVRRDKGGVTLTRDGGLAGNEVFLPLFQGAGTGNSAGVSLGNMRITSAVIRANPWMAQKIRWGNTLGIYLGDYVPVDDATWERRHPKGKTEPMTLPVVSRTDEELRLRESEDLDIIINLETGEIRSAEGDSYPRVIGYVHEVTVPLDGWGANRINIADVDSEEVLGYFGRLNETTWGQFSTTSVLQAEFREFERRGDYLELHQDGTGQILMMDLAEGVITRRYTTSPQVYPGWLITGFE